MHADQELNMLRETELLRTLYDSFNTRDIEAALATMHQDVVWANGIDGGYVYGHSGVREYWTQQWETIVSHADPIEFSTQNDGTIDVQAHLAARDTQGNVVFDTVGIHTFHIENGLIRRFDIQPAAA